MLEILCEFKIQSIKLYTTYNYIIKMYNVNAFLKNIFVNNDEKAQKSQIRQIRALQFVNNSVTKKAAIPRDSRSLYKIVTQSNK